MAIPHAWAKPSKIRAYIKAIQPKCEQPEEGAGFSFQYAGQLRGLLQLLDNLDPAVLGQSFDDDDIVKWTASVGAIQHVISAWGGDYAYEVQLRFDQAANRSPLPDLFDLLRKCPDEATPRAFHGLSFVTDPDLRESLARDVESLERFLRDEEWKALTVIGGSVVEALLLQGIEQTPRSVALIEGSPGWKKTGKPLDAWDLSALIAGSVVLGIISNEDADACSLARQFRNFIHPGKERLKKPCDKGTALSVLAAVYHLLERLR